MDIAITIVMLVPVLLAVALIIGVVRRNITERNAKDPVDISGAIPAVIVLMVAVLVIVAMGNASSSYVYDEDKGELTIQQNVPQLDVQPWDSYASDVRSLVIQDGVTVASGAFDTMNNLEYVSIGEGSEIASGAFGVSFEDPFGDAVAAADLDGYGYAGFGDGKLYQSDPSIYAYSSDGARIIGLASDSSAAIHIVLPEKKGTTTIRTVDESAFDNNTVIEDLLSVSECKISEIKRWAFRGCTALESAKVPESVRVMGISCFYGCTSLTTVELPNGITSIPDATFYECASLTSISIPQTVKSITYRAFYNCTGLTALQLPSGLESLTNGTFNGCTSIASVSFPASITSISGYVFNGCTGVTQISFEEGFSAALTDHWADAWSFYASDGTTALDKNVAANLAGKTFRGTNLALVEVAA